MVKLMNINKNKNNSNHKQQTELYNRVCLINTLFLGKIYYLQKLRILTIYVIPYKVSPYILHHGSKDLCFTSKAEAMPCALGQKSCSNKPAVNS